MRGSQVRPGHTATYSITVWTTRATSKDTTVNIKLRPAAHLSSPRFSSCPSASGATCSLGNRPAERADNLLASVTVGGQAARGEHVELIGDASATGAAPARASATVLVAGGAAPSSIPNTRAMSGVTVPGIVSLPLLPPAITLPQVTLPALPAAGITLNDPSVLFPTISPSPGPSAQRRPSASHVKPHATAALLPRDQPLGGASLAGLAVLAAAAIAMAIARYSRRARDGNRRPH